MKETRLNSLAILVLIPIIIMMSKFTPDSWLEGPFNHNTSGDFFSDANMVPNTLYYNNSTDFYTVWDESANKYVTYDKNTNIELQTVVFNAPDRNTTNGKVRLIGGWNNVASRAKGGERIVVAGAKVVPTSHLDEEGMRIQEQFGCAGCHEI